MLNILTQSTQAMAAQWKKLDAGSGATLMGWGGNTTYSLGPPNTAQSIPLTISGFSAPVSVAAGGGFSLVLSGSRTVQAIGYNNSGQLGNNQTSTQSAAVSVCGISTAVAIAASESHSLALLADGTVRAWGCGEFGKLGSNSAANRSTPVAVCGISTAIAVAAGHRHSLALLSDGSVRAWGANTVNDLFNFCCVVTGQLGNASAVDRSSPTAVTGVSNAVAIAAGNTHSMALISDGTIRAWGSNMGYDAMAGCVCACFGVIGNNSSNTNHATPVTVCGISTAIAIAASNYDSYALLRDGTIRSWGDNYYGQLGIGTTTLKSTPVAVCGISTAVVMSAGYEFANALLSNGTLISWGNGNAGQLADGSFSPKCTPSPACGISGAYKSTARALRREIRLRLLAGGSSHALFIKN